MNYTYESDIENPIENKRLVLYKELIQDKRLESVLKDYEWLASNLYLNF